MSDDAVFLGVLFVTSFILNSYLLCKSSGREGRIRELEVKQSILRSSLVDEGLYAYKLRKRTGEIRFSRVEKAFEKLRG